MVKKIILFALTLLFISSLSFAQDSASYGDIYPNQGSVNILLKIAGVDGESLVFNHEGEIDVLTWSWGMAQSGTMHVGGGGGSGKPMVEDVVLTKYVDRASPDLMLACLNGTHFSEAILTVAASSGDASFDYIVITMEPVLVTSVATGGNEEYGRITENVTLNFAKVTFSYIPIDPQTGEPLEPIKFTWNIEKNVQELP